MSIANGVVVSGLKEVGSALEQLPTRVSKNLVRRGLYAGGIVLRDEARRLVRVRTGALKKATVVKRGDPAKGQQSVSFGIARVRFVMRTKTLKSGEKKRTLKRVTGKGGSGFISPRRYAHLVELGSKRSAAHSFIMASANAKSGAAVDAMVRKMGTDLTDEIRKLKR